MILITASEGFWSILKLAFSFRGRINRRLYCEGLCLVFLILSSVTVAAVALLVFFKGDLLAFFLFYPFVLLLVSIWPLSALASKRLADIGLDLRHVIFLLVMFMSSWVIVNLLLNPVFFAWIMLIEGLIGFDLSQPYRAMILWIETYGVTPQASLMIISCLTIAPIVCLGSTPGAKTDFIGKT